MSVVNLDREEFIKRYVDAYVQEWAGVSRSMLPIGESYVDHPKSVVRMLARANAAGLWATLRSEPPPR